MKTAVRLSVATALAGLVIMPIASGIAAAEPAPLLLPPFTADAAGSTINISLIHPSDYGRCGAVVLPTGAELASGQPSPQPNCRPSNRSRTGRSHTTDRSGEDLPVLRRAPARCVYSGSDGRQYSVPNDPQCGQLAPAETTRPYPMEDESFIETCMGKSGQTREACIADIQDGIDKGYIRVP